MNTPIRYPYSRLAFRREIIEQLSAAGCFEVETPDGTFRFTRDEFEKEFPKVVQSPSYAKNGLYHYPRTPQKAFAYLVGADAPGPRTQMAKSAIFINGVYVSVLQEILDAQDERGGGDSFLQPYSSRVIRMLKAAPTSDMPVTVYLSTTEQLNQVSYVAEIVRWEDKRTLQVARKKAVAAHLRKYQQGETMLFGGTGKNEDKAVNLITIRNLQALESPVPTSLLIKRSDGLPLKKRTQSGGTSEVVEVPDLLYLPICTRDETDDELASEIARATSLSAAELKRRLSNAPKIPKRIQIISMGFRRNAHVIVAVLRRAKDTCEGCGKKAPFKRRSDGSPYLEVHHRIPLGEGGEDTVSNALALCPNCHRKAHHG